MEGNNKRKSVCSPEAAQLSRKEKKILKSEEKRLKKLERKQEYKQSGTKPSQHKNGDNN